MGLAGRRRPGGGGVLPKMSLPSLNFLIIGAGSRGTAYARAVNATTITDSHPVARIAAVAEPDPFKRAEFGRNFIWGGHGHGHGHGREGPRPGQEFSGWKEWIAWEDARRRRTTTKARAGDGEVDVERVDELGDAEAEAEVVITGVFVCTLDDSHAEILRALAHLQLHVLCEKPLALSLEDCLSIRDAYTTSESNQLPHDDHHHHHNNNHHPDGGSHVQQPQQQQQKIFSIGHVLRYSPHNTLLRRLLLQDRVIGDVVSLEHTEPIGWWHFTHSYVRGNWRHTTPQGVGTLLTKSCHDIDFIMWLLSSPADPTDALATPHLPSAISSTGSLTHFRRARKPQQAGAATNCTACALGEQGCAFSAKKIYRDRWLRGQRHTGWPLNIVVPEIEDIVSSSSGGGGGGGWEAAESALIDRLAEDYDATDRDDVAAKRVKDRSWYGRCVYESDNDVVDDQTVTITWDEEEAAGERRQQADGTGNTTTRVPKTALFHLSFATQAQCDRRGRIYGSRGEISYDSKRIRVYTFADDGVVEHVLPDPRSDVESNHGGGDVGLARSFVDAVRAVDAGEMDAPAAQRRFVGGDLDEMVRSHAVVFAAEEARIRGKTVRFRDWWAWKQIQIQSQSPRRMQTQAKGPLGHLDLCEGRLPN